MELWWTRWTNFHGKGYLKDLTNKQTNTTHQKSKHMKFIPSQIETSWNYHVCMQLSYFHPPRCIDTDHSGTAVASWHERLPAIIIIIIIIIIKDSKLKPCLWFQLYLSGSFHLNYWRVICQICKVILESSLITKHIFDSKSTTRFVAVSDGRKIFRPTSQNHAAQKPTFASGDQTQSLTSKTSLDIIIHYPWINCY